MHVLENLLHRHLRIEAHIHRHVDHVGRQLCQATATAVEQSKRQDEGQCQGAAVRETSAWPAFVDGGLHTHTHTHTHTQDREQLGDPPRLGRQHHLCPKVPLRRIHGLVQELLARKVQKPLKKPGNHGVCAEHIVAGKR